MSFDELHPGASLLLAWQLKGKRVLIVGGGQVASGRLSAVLEADALVTLISPLSGLHPEVSYRIFSDPFASSRITYIDRQFSDASDLDGIYLALTAIDDVDASGEIHRLCKERKIPVNVADVPPNCDFYFGSIVRRGPLQILISTNGRGPKLANLVKKPIEASLPPNVGPAIEKVGILRQKLRERAPGVGGPLGRKRMSWMTKVCNTWSFGHLAAMDEDIMDRLLNEGWEKGKVPTYAQLTGKPAWAQWIGEWMTPSKDMGIFAAGFAAGIAVCAGAFLARQR